MQATQTSFYVPPDTIEAYDVWGANCGPAALAALTRRTVMSLREHCQPWKGYLSLASMLGALWSVKVAHHVHRRDFKLTGKAHDPTRFGGRLSLIQWGGPWLREGIHPSAALCRTHWVAVRHRPLCVYDVNADDWQDPEDWEYVARTIMAEVPRCDGTWTVRGSILVDAAVVNGG